MIKRASQRQSSDLSSHGKKLVLATQVLDNFLVGKKRQDDDIVFRYDVLDGRRFASGCC